MESTRHGSASVRRSGLAVLLVLPLLMACSGPPTGPSDEVAQDGAAGLGVLTGNVSRGPLSSVVIPGAEVSAPVAGAKVIASSPGSGGMAGSAVSGSNGLYLLSLPPGTYVVTLGAGTDFLFSKDLPATVVVGEGQTTTLDLMLDTGIR